VEANTAVSPWGKMSLARWLAHGIAEPEPDTISALYKCTSCGACTEACKHEVDVASTLQSAREHWVRGGRSAYAADLFDVPVEQPDAPVFPPGVSGARLYAAGYTEAFRSAARACAQRWHGLTEIHLSSTEDLRCIRDVYPAYGVTIGAQTTLAAMSADAPDLSGESVAYHQSCHLGRYLNDEASALRERVTPNLDLVELESTVHPTLCCGASGGYAETSAEGARLAAERVLDRAVSRGATVLLTGCGGCAAHLRSAVGERSIRVVGLADKHVDGQ
jgi:Fe-S oxidoreductase